MKTIILIFFKLQILIYPVEAKANNSILIIAIKIVITRYTQVICDEY